MSAMPLETPEMRRFALRDLVQEPVRRTPDGAIDVDFYLGRGRTLRSRAFRRAAGRLAAWLRGRRSIPVARPVLCPAPRLAVVMPLPPDKRSRTNL